jgi:hypothetical protein
MPRLIARVTLAVVFCAVPGAVMGAILPDHFGNWQAQAPATTLKVQDLGSNWAQWTNGERVLQEAGLNKIEQRGYRNGDDQVTLRVFVLRDPSSAFEFYTFLLAPGMSKLGLGEDSALSQYDGRFLIGNLVVQATFSANTKPDSLTEVVSALKAKADPTPLPPLKNYLPEKWRVFGSEKYTLGPEGFRAAMSSLDQGAYAELAKEVGFQNGVEAMLARFHSDRDDGVLLLLEYPTPQLAEQHLHHLEEALPTSAKKAGVTIERKASLLSLVFAAASKEYAQRLRDEVNYETQVTWNESSHTATDPPIVVIMVKIFLFTGMFLGIATGVGIAFGGLRVIVKRLFPGKVFDRPSDIEVLQLGLSGKKIDPTDMY